MALLEGRLGPSIAPLGGGELAIVDESALVSSVENGESFVDEGTSGTGQISVYVVRKGDTLSSIAKMFGVSTNTIIWANNIKGSVVKEGMELTILPVSGVRHIVKSGETLKSITAKYKGDIDEVLAFNGLSADTKLSIGDTIVIPDGVLSSSATTQSGSAGTALKSTSGYYIRPIVGGRRSQGIHGYNGVDLAAPTGTNIRASAAGKVIISRTGGYNGGYGTYVVISHTNGTQTLYAHLSENYVSVGQYVDQGESIGSVGNTGKSTGPHIHFEVRGAKNPF